MHWTVSVMCDLWHHRYLSKSQKQSNACEICCTASFDCIGIFNDSVLHILCFRGVPNHHPLCAEAHAHSDSVLHGNTEYTIQNHGIFQRSQNLLYMYSRFHMRWTLSVTLMHDPCMGSWILHLFSIGKLYMSWVMHH